MELMSTNKINLKAYNFSKGIPPASSGQVLRKTRLNQELAKARQSNGLVTQGILEATQIEGGYGWAISDYIEFAYRYSFRPTFTCGLDGTVGGDEMDFSAGDRKYTKELPASIAALTVDDYQPAIFVPRVIHWHIEGDFYLGCYLLVCQVNSESTELNKPMRIHFRFEGTGTLKPSPQ
jgi:hypothetical protein